MGRDLETFLNSIDHNKVQKQYGLTFKNFDENNAIYAVDELKRLDNLFNIKEKVLVESSTNNTALQILYQNLAENLLLPTNNTNFKITRNNNKEC